MANKRIYDLDQQSAYSGSLFVECDDSSFSASRKIDLSTIAPRIDTLSSASSINTATWLVRLNSGAGDEFKSTMDNFMAQFTEKFNNDKSLFYTTNGDPAGRLMLERINGIVTGLFKWDSGFPGDQVYQLYTDSGGSNALILPSSMRPSYDCTTNDVFALNSGSPNRNAVIIQSNGEVYVAADDTSQDATQLSYVTF